MPDAFISYSRQDLRFVQQLVDALKKNDKEAWFDQNKEPLSGITTGTPWWEQIQYGIENSDKFLFVISPNSISSPYCHAEFNQAQKYSKQVVPVLYCRESGESETRRAIEVTIEAIPYIEVFPSPVKTEMVNMKTLVRANWLAISEIQPVIFSSSIPFDQSLEQLIQALDLDLAWVKMYSQLLQAAKLWEVNNFHVDYLWRGTRLDAVNKMVKRARRPLEPVVSQFIAASAEAVLIKPLFGLPSTDFQYKANIFTLMPFDEKIEPVYEDHLKNVAKKLDLSIKRADDFFSKSSIMRDIWSGIFLSEVVIADCTGRNANVFYELGIAHTLGKPTVMITQNPKDIPFDLQHLRFIPYDFTPLGMHKFEEATVQAVSMLMASSRSRTSVDEFTVEPIFGFPSLATQYTSDIFMVMPFDETIKPIYENHIKEIAKTLHLSIKRGDNFYSNYSIMGDIWAAMYAAKLIIADCTGRNVNVFYELGIAHTLGKPTLLITQNRNDIPYDVQAMRHIFYEYTPRGMQKFSGEIRDAIIKILELPN